MCLRDMFGWKENKTVGGTLGGTFTCEETVWENVEFIMFNGTPQSTGSNSFGNWFWMMNMLNAMSFTQFKLSLLQKTPRYYCILFL